MKTFVLTPARNNKTSDQHRGFIKPPLRSWGGKLAASVGGFYFGIFALVRAIQLKEVAIAKAGINLNRSTIAFQKSFRKESTL